LKRPFELPEHGRDEGQKQIAHTSLVTYVFDKLILHSLAELDKLTTEDNKAISHITVDTALVFFVVTAVFDFCIVL
jgi:hypothetical protein